MAPTSVIAVAVPTAMTGSDRMMCAVKGYLFEMRPLRCVLALVAFTAVACGGGADSGSAPTDMTFTGVVQGSALLVGQGAGHVCGSQGNGTYYTALRAAVGGERVVVNIEVVAYTGPKTYKLSRGGNVVTLRMQGVSSDMLSPAWQSTEGTVSIGSTGFAGTMQAKLSEVSPTGQQVASPSEATLDGHWSCS